MSEPNDSNVQVIENATLDAGRTGDHITWEEARQEDGVAVLIRREGIAHHRAISGDWCTKGGRHITFGEGKGVNLTIRRPAQDLPTDQGAVIIPAEGHESIKATRYGRTWRTVQAALDFSGAWVGAWRSEADVIAHIAPEKITPGTWKVGNR